MSKMREIKITQMSVAARLMKDWSHTLGAVISIRSFGQASMKEVSVLHDEKIPVLELRYEDGVREDPNGPTPELVAQIITFLRTQVHGEGKLLIHCEMGVSRSTSTGLIAMHLQGMSEEDAFQHLFDITHKPWPNLDTMIIADSILGTHFEEVYKVEMPGGHRMWETIRSSVRIL